MRDIENIDAHVECMAAEAKFEMKAPFVVSLAWPDPFRPGAYRLEIISTGLQGSGTVHSIKTNRDHQALVGDDWKHAT